MGCKCASSKSSFQIKSIAFAVHNSKLNVGITADLSFPKWLRTADAAMRTQQTQLMLIVENMDLPLVNKPTVYEDVMNVWHKTLDMVESLVSGSAQSVQSGETLLGLSAWHIYPDICALGQKTTMVYQRDSLVKDGGLATIGLKSSHRRDSTGVSWSIPLAHLRYYGRPVMSHGKLGSSTSRISFVQMMHIAMGSIMSTWQTRDSTCEMLASYIISFSEALQPLLRGQLRLTWPALFASKAEKYLRSSGKERKETERFIALGRRRHGSFLTEEKMHPAPFFGLSDPGLFVQCLKLENRVAVLREMAPLFQSPFGLDMAIVRFVHEVDPIGSVLEFASLFPQAIPGTTTKTHRRWLVLPYTNYAGDSSGFHTQWEPIIIRRSLEINQTLGEPCGFLSADTFARIDSEWKHPTITDKPDYTWNIMRAPQSTEQDIELLVRRSNWADGFLPPHERLIGWQRGHLEHNYEGASYKFAFGDVSSAAVYQPYYKFRSYSYDLSLAFVTEALGTGRLEPPRLSSHFEDCTIPVLAAINTPEYFRSLIALSTAHEIYDGLTQADVDISVISRPIARARWASTSLSKHMFHITRNV